MHGDESRDVPTVELSLSLKAAETLHAALEDLLDGSRHDSDGDATLERLYRVLAWRILAFKGGAGLTGRMAELARESSTLEEYEAARDTTLGPILDGLESAENRDP